MEVNSSKCAQGKITFRTSERRRYPEHGSHLYILIGQCSTAARTYWVHCTRGARFDLLIMLPEISDAHTDTLCARFEMQCRLRRGRTSRCRQKRYARIDSRNSTDNRIRVRWCTRKMRKFVFSFRRSWFVQKAPTINYNRFTCSNFETIETVCRHKGSPSYRDETRRQDRLCGRNDFIDSEGCSDKHWWHTKTSDTRKEGKGGGWGKKEWHETDWRHHINLPDREPPHKYNREGKASWWLVGIARRTVTDSARRIGRGNLRGGGVRWVDVSGAEWRLKREGSGGRLLSLHGATHGGVKHGETVRMIDGILRRCRHAMGVYSPLPFAGELDAHTINRNPPLLVIPVVWWGTSTW